LLNPFKLGKLSLIRVATPVGTKTGLYI